MIQEKIKQGLQIIKRNLVETFRLLRSFKWYIFVYLIVYCYYWLHYSAPSAKYYFDWQWRLSYDYETDIYLAEMELFLTALALLFLVGTSNMRNHPLLAKLIFLSSIYIFCVFSA